MDGAIRGDENGTEEEKERDREITSPTFQPRLRPRCSHRPTGHQSSCTKRLKARPTDGNKPRLLGRGPGPRAGTSPPPGPARGRGASKLALDGIPTVSEEETATSRHAGAAISHASQGELESVLPRRATPRHGYCTVSTTARLCIISRPSSPPPPSRRRRLSSRYTASRITTTTITSSSSSSSSKRSIHPIVLRRRPGPVSVRQRAPRHQT